MKGAERLNNRAGSSGSGLIYGECSRWFWFSGHWGSSGGLKSHFIKRTLRHVAAIRWLDRRGRRGGRVRFPRKRINNRGVSKSPSTAIEVSKSPYEKIFSVIRGCKNGQKKLEMLME